MACFDDAFANQRIAQVSPRPARGRRKTYAPRRRSPKADGGARRQAHGEPLEAAAEVARYIADMTVQMASMARAANLDMVVFFLEMARVEAEAAAHKVSDDERP
jgi:hypothetical protein